MANGDNNGITLAKVRSGSVLQYDPITKNDDIMAIQTALQCFGYYPASGTIDGYYGSNTSAGVRGFQHEQGLTADGILNSSTLSSLENITGTLTTSTSCPTLVRVRNGLSYFKSGHTGSAVSTIRSKLSNLGYDGGSGTTYNASLTAVVKEFQTDYGLTSDGTVGQATLAVLENSTSDTDWVTSAGKVNLTPGLLARCGFSKNCLRAATVASLNANLNQYSINTKVRVRHFLSQALAETGGYNMMEYGYKPGEENTSITYAPYMGAGWIHVTHNYNYESFQTHIQESDGVTDSAIMTPALYASLHMATKYPARAAAWFWSDYSGINSKIANATSEASASYAVTRSILGNNAASSDLTKRYNNYVAIKSILK